jgi:transcriptional regulator with XRE-family HTH domain
MHLRTLRTRRGWTQDDLCKRSKVPQNSISRLEREASARPTLQTVLALAKAFAVDPLSIEFGPPRRKTRRKTPRATQAAEVPA